MNDKDVLVFQSKTFRLGPQNTHRFTRTKCPCDPSKHGIRVVAGDRGNHHDIQFRKFGERAAPDLSHAGGSSTLCQKPDTNSGFDCSSHRRCPGADEHLAPGDISALQRPKGHGSQIARFRLKHKRHGNV